MELFGLIFGKKSDIVPAIQRDLRAKLEKEISETLERLVGDEMKRLKKTLEDTQKSRDTAEQALSARKGEFDRTKSRLETFKTLNEALRYQAETAQERIQAELLDSVALYLRAEPPTALKIVHAMRGVKNLPYLAAFFRTCHGIDAAMTEAQSSAFPYGLQVLGAVDKGSGGKFDVDTGRAVTWYAEHELRSVPKEHRVSAFAYFIELSEKGKFDKPRAEYQKDQVHRDYVLMLSPTERELIRIRDQAFNGSWSAMLKTAEQPGRDTRSITLQEETALTPPLIRKIMDYELKNGVILEYSGKDF